VNLLGEYANLTHSTKVKHRKKFQSEAIPVDEGSLQNCRGPTLYCLLGLHCPTEHASAHRWL